MKPSCCALVVFLTLGALLETFNAGGDSATDNKMPPMPPDPADLSGAILPPIQPSEAPRVVPPAPAIPVTPPTGQLPNEVVAWDGDQKEAIVNAGEPEAHFKFNLTNVSAEAVTIHSVATSCGCTTAHLPPMPWKLEPGTNGEINVTLNLAGKSGTVFKTVTVSTDKGNKTLMVKAVIVAPPAGQMPVSEREQNQKLALADRQAIFKDDCARCHVAPAAGKTGKELYVSMCGICHEAEHRATMVTDLHALNHETNPDFWKFMISYGKPGSLMAAFAQSQGGPLGDEQIASLVNYLVETIPSKPGLPAPQMSVPR
jgi:mono/diheme cytochrome c family protein